MIHSLTSFRFAAAFMVFLYHVKLFPQYELGTAGVQFFFVLSGFILAWNYHSKFKPFDNANIYKFYKARFAKIYPVHLLTFLLAAPLVILYFHPNGLYMLKLAFMSVINLLLIQSYIPNEGTYFNFNGVSWTLSVEALFYLSFPFLLRLMIKWKTGGQAAASLTAIFLLWLLLFWLNSYLNEANPFSAWLLHIFPFTRLFEFSTGMVLGLLFVERTGNPPRLQLLNVLEWVGLAAFFGLLIASKYMPAGMVRGVYFVPVWCLFIYVFAFQAGTVSRLLSHRLFVYLGEISFSFYMIHQLVIRYVQLVRLDSPLGIFVCFAISLLLSAVIYRWYEEPLRKRIRFGSRKRPQAPANPLPVESA